VQRTQLQSGRGSAAPRRSYRRTSSRAPVFLSYAQRGSRAGQGDSGPQLEAAQHRHMEWTSALFNQEKNSSRSIRENIRRAAYFLCIISRSSWISPPRALGGLRAEGMEMGRRLPLWKGTKDALSTAQSSLTDTPSGGALCRFAPIEISTGHGFVTGGCRRKFIDLLSRRNSQVTGGPK